MKPRRKIRNYTGDPEFMFTRRFNTPLLGKKKKEFKEWANTPGEDGRLPINDVGAYDMQGYWKEYISKGVNPNDEDNHGPDTFKKPNHPSFSDESKHSSKRWPGGQWQEDGGFRAAKHTRHLYGKNLKRYFEEEGRPEYLIEEKDGGGDVKKKNNNTKNVRAIYGPVWDKLNKTYENTDPFTDDDYDEGWEMFNNIVAFEENLYTPKKGYQYHVPNSERGKEIIPDYVWSSKKEDYIKRNVPPIDPVISEIHKKINNLSQKDAEKLLSLPVHNKGISISDIPAIIKHSKTAGVSITDLYRYMTHIKKLGEQGYTFKYGGNMKTKKLRTGGTALLLPRIRAKRQTGGFVFDDMPEGDPPVGMPILPISNKAKAIAEEIYDPGSPSTTLAPEEDPFINAPPPMVAGQKNRKLKRQWDRYRKLVKEMPHTKRIQQTDPARGKGDTRFEGGGDVNRKKVDKVKKHWSSATLEELEEIRNPKKYPNFPLVPKDLRGTENPDTAYSLTQKLNKRTLPRLLTTSHMRDVLFPQFQSKGGTRDASPEFKSGINELIDEKSKSKSTRRMRIGQAPYQEGESIPREFGGYSMDMSDNLTMFPSDLVDYYGLGGWLKKNVGNVLKTAAGVGSMFIPGMQGVGAGMIAGGVGGMVSGEQEAEETAEVYRPPVAKANQVYDVPMEMGGNLKQATKRTDYQGPSHEGGGIPLGETGVEVEGEESRTGDMIHSDKIKLTKNMYKRYGGMVPLKKSDIGKSVAQILKKTDKKFEKRSGDKWNDEARKATQEPFEMMSDELSQIYAIAQDGVQEMRGGGKPDFEFVRGTKNNNYQLPEGFHLKDKKNFEMLSDFLSDDGAYEGMSPIRQFEDYRKMIQDGKATGDTTAVHGVLKKLQDWSAKHQDDPMVDKDQYFPPMQKEYGGNTIEAEGGFDLGSFFNKENLAGNMPIIGSAFGAASSMLRKPEKVKYEQARISPTKVTPISTEGGINRIRSTFGNTRERMRRMNPRGYMNTMRDMGAAEAGAIGDYSGQVTAQNTMMQNQASMQDSQAQTRVNMHNSELAAKEAEANAANRGAKRSTTDAYLNNMFTQFGQKSRDDRSYAAQDKYMDMMGKHLEGVRSIYGNNQEGLPGEMPYTPFDINEIYDPWKEKNIGFGNPMSRYGGKLRRLYGGRLRRLNKLAV